MLDQAFQAVDDDHWIVTVNDWTYADMIYHIIITQAFYIRDSPKGMEWGHLYGDSKQKESNPTEYYPNKETLLHYHFEVKKTVENYLSSISDEDLYKSDGFKSHLSSIHKKLVYLLRHNSHHLGELALMHRNLGLNRVKWV
jgi:hypothetical protein